MKSVLAFFLTASTMAATTTFLDVSDQFDASLKKMLHNLKDLDFETASIGTFPRENLLFQNAFLGNFTTLRRTSEATLLEMWGRLSVEGGISLENMYILETENGATSSPIQKIVVRENLWNYNFWINQISENCYDGGTVLLTDIGQMETILENGEKKDETYWIKHHMDESTWEKLSSVMAEVLKKHFNFCHLTKS